mgnify:CR=1 FL=1
MVQQWNTPSYDVSLGHLPYPVVKGSGGNSYLLAIFPRLLLASSVKAESVLTSRPFMMLVEKSSMSSVLTLLSIRPLSNGADNSNLP